MNELARQGLGRYPTAAVPEHEDESSSLRCLTEFGGMGVNGRVVPSPEGEVPMIACSENGFRPLGTGARNGRCAAS